MTRSQRVRYEMLQRIRGFGTNHQDRFPEASIGARAFADIARIVASIDAHVTRKIVAVRESRRAKADRKAQMLVRMKAIVRTSKSVQSGTGAPLRLRMPRRRSATTVLGQAQAFLVEAEPYKDQLVALGLPPEYLAGLREATNAFGEALEEERSGRSAVAAAQTGITLGLAEGMKTARTLDVIVVNVLGDDPTAIAAWKRSLQLVTWEGKGEREKPATAPAEPLRKAS